MTASSYSMVLCIKVRHLNKTEFTDLFDEKSIFFLFPFCVQVGVKGSEDSVV